jgi:hypothetical protein
MMIGLLRAFAFFAYDHKVQAAPLIKQADR